MDGSVSLAFAAVELGFEAQQVIALRLAHLFSGNPLAVFEAERMVTEKILAAGAAAITIAAGMADGSSQTDVARQVLDGYSTRVRDNRRRLSAAAD